MVFDIGDGECQRIVERLKRCGTPAHKHNHDDRGPVLRNHREEDQRDTEDDGGLDLQRR